MAIVQVAFDIPESIMTKILTGDYVRIGGVVRHAVGANKGQIVKHLEPIDLKAAEQIQGLGVKIIESGKLHKKTLIIGGVITTIAGFGVIIYHKLKNREPKIVSEFRVALKTYINAIREGSLEVDTINNLLESLIKIKEHKCYEKINIKITTEEIGVFINQIHGYTEKLVSDNSFELTEEEKMDIFNENKNIIDLQNYLKVQKRIFEVA